MAAELTLLVNGAKQVVSVAPETPLLFVLRNELKLTGPAHGLRDGAVRGVRGAAGWRRSAHLHHAGILRRGQASDDHRRAASALGGGKAI